MADKNQLKIADQVDLADDDPFAELTRIMGFDPRQPAKRMAEKQAAAEKVPAEQAPEEDDFSLDLEKELLGGFEDETPELSAEAAEPVAEAQFSEPEAPEADLDFAADFEAAMAASAEDEADSREAADFDLGLTEADVRALDGHDAPPVEDEAEAEFDLGLTEEDVSALDAEEDQPAAAEAVADELPLAASEEEDADFDLGLTDDDVRALDAEVLQPSATVEAASADEDAADIDIDAAMADIDMDFAAVEAAPAAEAADAAQDETGGTAPEDNHEDLHLLDDDFHVEEEAVEPVAESHAEPQAEIDESAFSFSDDELRFDDAHPAEEGEPSADEQAAGPSPDELSFDDVDLGDLDVAAEELPASAEAAVEEPAAGLAGEPEADSLPRIDLSAPRQEPRKLPVSPMDVAAEEVRQREATAKQAEPEFNLEDELNALLGNIRASQAATQPGAAVPQVQEPAAGSTAFEASGPSAYEPPSFRPAAPAAPAVPVSFDPPARPADIEDNLNWELDDAFAAETGPEQTYEDQAEAFADDDQEAAYAEDGQFDAYADAGQPQDAYAYADDQQDAYALAPPEAGDDLASLDFSDMSFELVEDDPQSRPHYGDAVAGAAIGAAAARFASGRSFDAGASARLSDLPRTPADAWSSEHFAAQPQAAADDSFTTHRDPVVRGNPMKEDPLDVITALAEKYSRKEPVTPYGRAMGVAAGSLSADEDMDISAAFEEQPEVETVEVADQAIALADDLDIPELAEDEELPPVSAYDDLDAEFSSLLSDMNGAQPAIAQGAAFAGGDFAARPYENPRQAAQPAAKTYDDDPEPDSFALDADDLPGSRMPSGGQYAADEYDYDPDMDQEIAPQHLAAENSWLPKSRGMLLAALVGGVALLGGIGAFALSFGDGSGGDAPALVRAEEGPLKVKPENPGGTTVPNQENKVYETVAGEDAAGAPQQEKLVTTAEEPVDVTPPPPADEAPIEEDVAAASSSGKGEDRIEQILQEAENQPDSEIAAVAPRKVRTMVVKPDGTLVPREDEPASPEQQPETVAAAVPETAPAQIIPEATGALPAAPEVPGLAPAPEEAAAPEQTPAPEETAAATPLPPSEESAPQPATGEPAGADPESADRGAMPETAPIAPLRPADQPIDVVGEVKADKVAAATTAAAGGNWAMQIASQPSEAAAQSSYQDLARRYGSVLQGKDVNIVKAEIAGKGTFWRVRVPAASRNEAISLCENYKAAGGNCFVSR